MTFSLSLTIKKILNDIFHLKTDKIDASRLEGKVPLDTIPAAALERVLAVQNDASRFSLTKENVQNGDTVKVIETNKMYLVKDENQLSNENGYEEYVAGRAAYAETAEVATLARNSEKIENLTLNDLRDEVKTYPANLQDQSIKNRHLAPDLRILGTNIADRTITKNHLAIVAGDIDAYNKGEVETIIDSIASEKVNRSGGTMTGALKFENTSASTTSCFPSHYYHNLYNNNDTVYVHAFPSHPSPAKPTKFEFRTANGTQNEWTAHTLSKDGFTTPTLIFNTGGYIGDYNRDAGDAISDNGGANINIGSWYGLGFYSTCVGKYTGSMDLRTGNWRTLGTMKADGGFIGNLTGTASNAERLGGKTTNELGFRKIGNRTVSGYVDWNTLTEPTTYRIQGAIMNAAHHAPPNEYDFGLLIVNCLENGADGEWRTIQIYFPHSCRGYWSRMYNGSADYRAENWLPWIYIPTHNEVETIAEQKASTKVSKNGDTITGDLTVSSIYVNDWFRVNGENNGIYWQKYGGGWHMTDHEWIRTWNGKHIYTSGKIRCNAGFEGNLRGTADMALKIKGDRLIFENGTQLWIE